MGDLIEQISTRDAALLTYIGIFVVITLWSVARRGSLGSSMGGVIRAACQPRLLLMFGLAAAWQIGVVCLASLIGLWRSDVLKDTVVLVLVGTVMSGLRAINLIKGKVTWRSEILSLVALVVVVQFVANLKTFPYVIELILIPLGVLLACMEVVASREPKFHVLRPILNFATLALGVGILVRSLWVVFRSLGETEWDTVARQFALAFWLPASLLPIIYLLGLWMQYGEIQSRLKFFNPHPALARRQLVGHFRGRLCALSRFANTRGTVNKFAQANTPEERATILENFPVSRR